MTDQLALTLVQTDQLIDRLRAIALPDCIEAAGRLETLQAQADELADELYRLNGRQSDLTVAYGRLKFAARVAAGQVDPADDQDPMDGLVAWLKAYAGYNPGEKP